MSSDAAQRLWEAALGRLQLQTPRPTFDTWLAGTAGGRLDDDLLVVSVPTAFAAEWIEHRIHSLVEEAVSAVAGHRLAISYVVGQVFNALPEGASTPTPPPGRAPQREAGQLRLDYTFDSFVVGPGNQLAHAAAMAVADAPGSAYNPLFLYGSVGLGKTHLMHAIGHRTTAAGRLTLYVTSEQFTNEYLSAIRERKTNAFRARFRSIEVLLVDDVQFLAGKEATQEGFFHTFNALHGYGGQLVMTSDRPAGELRLLEARLRSRFEAGLQADITPPDYETRVAMLTSFASGAGIVIAPSILGFIAERVCDSVRTLRGCFTRLEALAAFTGRPITLDLARDALGPQSPPTEAVLSPEAILQTIAAWRRLPTIALTGSRRDREASSARQVAMHLLHTLLGTSPEEIGAILGNRDRTTILYGLRRASEAISRDKNLALEVESIRDSLKSISLPSSLSTPA